MGARIPIKYKIITMVLSVVITIFIVTIGYLVVATREIMLRDVYRSVRLHAENSALQIRARLEHYMGLTYGLAKAFEENEDLPVEEWSSMYLDMLVRVYKDYPDMVSLWDSYEYSAYVPGYTRSYGRLYQHVYTLSNGEIKWEERELSKMGDPLPYAIFKAKNYASIWEPYQDLVVKGDGRSTMMTTVATPIQIDGNFAGLVGVDISLDWLQVLIENIQPFEGSEAFLLSSEGVIAAHPRDTLLMSSIEVLFPEDVRREGLREKIREGLPASFTHVDRLGRRYSVHLAPVRIEKSGEHWSVGVVVPLSTITSSADKSAWVGLWAGLIAVGVLVVLLVLMSDNISRPIVRITDVLRRLARGEIDSNLKQEIRSGDEIEHMSVALNSLIDGLGTKNALARSIGGGDLSLDIPLLSEQDMLGQSLIAMRNSLRVARKEEEARAQDSRERAWASEGLSEFNEFLRVRNYALEELCEEVLLRLVRFLDANMGAIYLLDKVREQCDEGRYYELYTTFAWGRKRYLEKVEYEEGVGLVGSCALERKPVFLTDIPEDYMFIPTGVGDVRARCVVLMPLLHDNMAIGVVELASVEEYAPYQVSFLEDVCRAIASSIFSVQMESRTTALLEQSREQAEMLSSQEEELRQNLEELSATQEETLRRTEEMEGLVNALSRVMHFIEFDEGGYITGVSQSYLTRIKRRREMVLNTHYSDWIKVKGWGKQQFEQFWREVCHGGGERLEANMSVLGDEVPVREFYIPVRNKEGAILKVVKLAYEVTEG